MSEISARTAFEPIATEMLYVATPGATSADLATFTYPAAMFPCEPDATYWPRRLIVTPVAPPSAGSHRLLLRPR